MTELLLHPNIMLKVREEVTKTIGAEGRIEESKILALPYLHAIVKESMRLHLSVVSSCTPQDRNRPEAARFSDSEEHPSPCECVGHCSKPELLGKPNSVHAKEVFGVENGLQRPTFPLSSFWFWASNVSRDSSCSMGCKLDDSFTCVSF
ncbi:unnamed protein product [Camellia sinensis]